MTTLKKVEPGTPPASDAVDAEAAHLAAVERLTSKQKAFIAAVLGGPNPWKGKDLRRAHDSLDLNESHFNAIAENLQASLKEMKVDPKLIGEVMAIVASTKNDVLNR